MSLMIIIEGKVFDVGNIDSGRGFAMEVEGEDVAVTGLTEEETKNVGRFLGQRITLTIAVPVQKPQPAEQK